MTKKSDSLQISWNFAWEYFGMSVSENWSDILKTSVAQVREKPKPHRCTVTIAYHGAISNPANLCHRSHTDCRQGQVIIKYHQSQGVLYICDHYFPSTTQKWVMKANNVRPIKLRENDRSAPVSKNDQKIWLSPNLLKFCLRILWYESSWELK